MQPLSAAARLRPGSKRVATLSAGACLLAFVGLGAMTPGGYSDVSRAVGGVLNWDSLRSAVGGFFSGLPGRAPPQSVVVKIAASTAPEPPVLKLQALTPDQAVAWNAAIPISATDNRPAPAFRFPATSMTESQRALDCMTAAIFYEAASESEQGQHAVAQVVLNRLRHPAYPKTVCGVVFQGAGLKTGCQFTFTCDGALGRQPSVEGWDRARRVAEAALGGYVEKSVGAATHYHTIWVAPYWRGELVKVALIGAHIFYRWDGGWSLPRDALSVYAGGEPDVVKLYGVGAAPFTQPRIQLAILEAPVPAPHTPPPAEPAEVEKISVATVATIAAPAAAPALPQMVVEPLAVDRDGPTAAIGEVRRNRQVPLPSGW